MSTRNLLVELFVEELPPKALKKLGEAFSGVLAESLKSAGLLADVSMVTTFASPRRLAAHITHVSAKAADKQVAQKLMPATVGLDASGNASPALVKKLQALGENESAVAKLRKENEVKKSHYRPVKRVRWFSQRLLRLWHDSKFDRLIT